MTDEKEWEEYMATKLSLREKIGNNTRALRLSRGLSQRAFGEKMGGMTHEHISRLEHGKTMPTIEVCKRLAGALELSLETFFRLTVEASPINNDPLHLEFLEIFLKLDHNDRRLLMLMARRAVSHLQHSR